MREEWKSASMRHGAQFVVPFVNGAGTIYKQILFVGSLGTLKQVRVCHEPQS